MKLCVLLFILTFTTCIKGHFLAREKRNAKASSIWTKLNSHPICFHARGNQFGRYTHELDGRLVGAIKLEHVSGFVRCTTNRVYDSYWGCHNFTSLMKIPLNVIITDSFNNILFPLAKYIRHNSGLWYYLPNTDARFSKELVFSNYMDPFYLPYNSHLRIWYGEDLTDWTEDDNHGKVCVNIHAHVL